MCCTSWPLVRWNNCEVRNSGSFGSCYIPCMAMGFIPKSECQCVFWRQWFCSEFYPALVVVVCSEAWGNCLHRWPSWQLGSIRTARVQMTDGLNTDQSRTMRWGQEFPGTVQLPAALHLVAKQCDLKEIISLKPIAKTRDELPSFLYVCCQAYWLWCPYFLPTKWWLLKWLNDGQDRPELCNKLSSI